jgi:uncharacterized membrane protein YqhA
LLPKLPEITEDLETPPATAPPELSTQTAQTERTGLAGFERVSVMFIVAALIFTGVGLYKLYDNSVDARVVGGDAYNYIIYATRGTAFICAGIVCAVLSVTFALFANTATKDIFTTSTRKRVNH